MTTTAKMRIVVLIPAYQEADSIAGTVEAVLLQTRPPDLVVVIPNGCTDNTATVARRYPVEVLELPRLVHKKSEALNTAWSRYATDADVVICLDADTILPSHAVGDWEKEMLADLKLAGSSSKFTMLTEGKKELVLGTPAGVESTWGAYLTRLQASEFSAWADTALRRKYTTVLAGTGCAIRGQSLREVVTATGQDGPWSYTSLTEDFYLTFEIRKLGYRCHVSPTVRAYTDSMKTVKALLAQRMKWSVGTVEDLLSIGINRHTLIDWWQQFAGLGMAAIRILWVALIIGLVAVGEFRFHTLWWVAVPVVFAAGQGLLSMRIPYRDWKDTALAILIIPGEHFAWMRAYWFIIGWAKAIRSRVTGMQEDLWSSQHAAEIRPNNTIRKEV